jgi:hypothetical protein
MMEVSPEAPNVGASASPGLDRVEPPVMVGGALKVGLTCGPDFEVEV